MTLNKIIEEIKKEVDYRYDYKDTLDNPEGDKYYCQEAVNFFIKKACHRVADEMEMEILVRNNIYFGKEAKKVIKEFKDS